MAEVTIQGKWVYVSNAKLMHATSKAMLVEIDGDEPIWVPLSQINLDESDVRSEDDLGVLCMSLWIAKQKNLVED